MEKLKLLVTDGQITAETVIAAVADNARYNLFTMADSGLQGDAAASLRMLYGLRGEGTEAAVVLWALVRELRSLYEIQVACHAGQDMQQAMRAQRIWNNKMPMVKAALSRHNLASLTQLLELAARADGSIKGFADGRPWDNLAALITGLSQPERSPVLG